MQISPWAAIGLNAAYAVLTGLSVPVVDALGFTGHDTQIVAWAGLAAIPLNMLLHGVTNSSPGPLAPPDAPVVVAAQKVANLSPSASKVEIAATKAVAENAVANHQP